MDKKVKANKTERIFKVHDILLKKTDEHKQLSLQDIIEILLDDHDKDYDTSLRSITNDLKILRSCEVDIRRKTVAHGKKVYSYGERLFETNELRVLMDSISSSASIGCKDKERIIDKIKKLTSENIGGKLENQVYTDYKIVNKDKTFRMNVDEMHLAIQNKMKIKFKYGRYDLNKEFVINQKEYIAHPYALIWDNGFYYLVAYDEEKEKFINFRVDRMREVWQIEEKYLSDIKFNLKSHMERCFNMYPGDMRQIRIEFDKHLINAIIDKFGVDIKIEKTDEGNFILTTTAAINKGLIRWILNWGSDAEVISPSDLIKDIKIELEKMNQIYNK